jgi:hypothetical protein
MLASHVCRFRPAKSLNEVGAARASSASCAMYATTQTGADTTSWLQTFSEDGNIRTVNLSTVRVFQDCLASERGYIWCALTS